MKPNYFQRRHSNRNQGIQPAGFTIIELLVVLGVVGMLFLTQLPALTRAKPKSQTARCASNMRMWGWATMMYTADNAGSLPYYGDVSTDYTKRFWTAYLTPYVARITQAGAIFGTRQEGMLSASTEIFTNEVRQCPGGSYAAPPYYKATWPSGTWNCWIGANFGAYGRPLSGPFYYGDINPPLNISRIRKPADALMFMDTLSQYVYSPLEPVYKFSLDQNGDGKPDSMPHYPSTPFNYARPTVHNGGANVTLMDGHVERITFDKLWKVDASGNVVHSFWYLED